MQTPLFPLVPGRKLVPHWLFHICLGGGFGEEGDTRALSMVCQNLQGEEKACLGPMDCLLWDLGNVTNFLLQLSWQLLSHYVLSPCFLDMFGDMGGDFCFLPWAWDYSLLRLHACVHFANHLGRKGAPQRPLRDPLPCCVLANESQWFREAGKSPHFLP